MTVGTDAITDKYISVYFKVNLNVHPIFKVCKKGKLFNVIGKIVNFNGTYFELEAEDIVEVMDGEVKE